MKKIKKNNVLKILKENRNYLFVIVGTLFVTIIGVFLFNSLLNTNEKLIYDIITENEDIFNNPSTIKLESAKICSEDYSIITISASNSYGADVSDLFYVSKRKINSDEIISKKVAEECLNNEINNYDSVIILSDNSVKKINSKLGGK